MTPEKLKEIERRYLENGDALDASSYCVLDLIHEVRALRTDNRMLNWQKEQLETKVATLQTYVDDVEWFNSALADKDWPVYCIEFIDGKPIGLCLVSGIPPEDMRQGDTLIEAIRAARKGAER